MSQTIQERNMELVLEEPIIASDPKNPPSAREILLLGPYGVLGTGVVPADAAAPNALVAVVVFAGVAKPAAAGQADSAVEALLAEPVLQRDIGAGRVVVVQDAADEAKGIGQATLF